MLGWCNLATPPLQIRGGGVSFFQRGVFTPYGGGGCKNITDVVSCTCQVLYLISCSVLYLVVSHVTVSDSVYTYTQQPICSPTSLWLENPNEHRPIIVYIHISHVFLRTGC